MTVRDNKALSLMLARVDKTAMDAKVGHAAEILGLTALLDRFPRQRSGGQRQRVAMGRAIGSEMPCLVNLQPSGKYLMQDLCDAGGLPAVMKEIASVLHLDHVTASGKSVRDNIAGAENWNAEVIKAVADPFEARAGSAVLRGKPAPRGALIKPSAATPALLQHTGRAVVFEDSDGFHARIDDENLEVDETCILVLVRISDARMSGAAYGTVVMHTAPEAAAGGPLALVKNGDRVTLDVAGRRLHLHVDDAGRARRRAAWSPPKPALDSGYRKPYIDHVLQADEGCDLDFLRGRRAAFVPKDNH